MSIPACCARARPRRSCACSAAITTSRSCIATPSELFLAKLAGVTDPEQKRKTIGATFIDVFDEEAHKIGGAEFLAQGTLYPDVIESVSATGGPSVTIKSHHNVGGLPERMKLKLVEPLRELFKDEVRELGRELGLPAQFVDRHPFPGPGLAIRIPGEVTRERLDILRKADAIFLEEIRLAGLYDAIWQAFAVLLPVRTVGVMGDARSLRLRLRAPGRHLDRRHDRRLLPVPARDIWAAPRPASSTRCAASTASSTTSPRSRPARSSGNDVGPCQRIPQYHVNRRSTYPAIPPQ